MSSGYICKFPWWPLQPFLPIEIIGWIVAVLGIIFTIVMLIDCLKRKQSEFYNPLTKDGVYDKLIWAVAIAVSLCFYFVGAIAYYFVVKRTKPEAAE